MSTRKRPLAERFLEKIEKVPSGCWEWTGAKNAGGYGVAWVDGCSALAHRAGYVLHIGSIPDGQVVMHTCDNPACVRPEHLRVGSMRDNTQDMILKGRRPPRHTRGNSRLSAEDVFTIRNSPESLRVTAARFGVSKSQISNIRRHKQWRV